MSNISFPDTFSDGNILTGAQLEALKAAITSAVNGGLDNGNITAAANIALTKLGDYQATIVEKRLTTSPAADGTTFATDLPGELRQLRYVLTEFFGSTYWFSRTGKGVGGFTTGDVKPTLKTTADTGWVMLNDGTIGDASSSGSTRFNADTEDLFTLIWTNFSDADCPLSSGTRAADVTAAVSFAAHKNIRLPLAVGRSMGVAGTPASANTNETVTLAASSSASATSIRLDSRIKFLTDDIINGYTLLVTSGARSGQTATVTDYAVNGAAVDATITVGAGLSGALSAGDTFTLTKVLSTRALGAVVGRESIIPVGSDQTGDTGGDSESLAGFGSSAATAATNETTNFAPTWFGNWMVKL